MFVLLCITVCTVMHNLPLVTVQQNRMIGLHHLNVVA